MFARDRLTLFGYSNLIKSYRDPYTIMESGRKVFRDNVKFEQLCSLYLLDKNLRNAVMASMLDFEEHLKEATADVIARAFGTHQDDYLQYRNYQNKKKRVKRFTLAGVLDTMKKALDTDKDPIHHYSEKYGMVPPWILFKSIYFSTIINYIDLFKPTERYKLMERIYDTTSIKTDEKALSSLMMDTLFTSLSYRNVAAHGGRIYNFSPNRQFHPTPELPVLVRGFSQLLFLLQQIHYNAPYEHLADCLQREINRHCSEYPSDVTYLGDTLQINIYSQGSGKDS